MTSRDSACRGPGAQLAQRTAELRQVGAIVCAPVDRQERLLLHRFVIAIECRRDATSRGQRHAENAASSSRANNLSAARANRSAARGALTEPLSRATSFAASSRLMLVAIRVRSVGYRLRRSIRLPKFGRAAQYCHERLTRRGEASVACVCGCDA
jgi:hypothetical protein